MTSVTWHLPCSSLNGYISLTTVSLFIPAPPAPSLLLSWLHGQCPDREDILWVMFPPGQRTAPVEWDCSVGSWLLHLAGRCGLCWYQELPSFVGENFGVNTEKFNCILLLNWFGACYTVDLFQNNLESYCGDFYSRPNDRKTILILFYIILVTIYNLWDLWKTEITEKYIYLINQNRCYHLLEVVFYETLWIITLVIENNNDFRRFRGLNKYSCYGLQSLEDMSWHYFG